MNPRYNQYELSIPRASRHSPLKKTRPLAQRAKVLRRAFVSARTDGNHTKVSFPSTTALEPEGYDLTSRQVGLFESESTIKACF
jgi:hypothetical protein